MNYEIRTMSFGELLDTGFRLVRNHFPVLLGIGLILFLPFELVQSFFVRGSPSAAATRALGEAFLGREPAIGDAYPEEREAFLRALLREMDRR